MEFSNIVLLYSKYSPNSKKMLDILQHSNLDLRLLSIQKVCIDNENIRKSIISDSSIEIKTVPTILVLYPDGGVEKFDGSHSFQFIENVIQNYIKMNTPQSSQSQQQPQQQIKRSKLPQIKSSSKKTSIHELFSESEEENENEDESQDGLEIIESAKPIQEPSARNIKSNNNTSSILAKAQELAKVREKEDASQPKRPLVM